MSTGFMRGLVRVFALGLLAITSHSHALSLGEISVLSSLNQPLQAEIALYTTQPGEIVDVNVILASNEVHEQLGINMADIVRKLKFKVKRNPAGQFVIMLTTRQPVREPILDFVIDVSGSAVNLRRGYSIHLDPPAF